MRLHHVQVAGPPGGEDDARRFWVDGLVEVDKPADLRARGGAWFRAHDDRGEVGAEVRGRRRPRGAGLAVCRPSDA